MSSWQSQQPIWCYRSDFEKPIVFCDLFFAPWRVKFDLTAPGRHHDVGGEPINFLSLS